MKDTGPLDVNSFTAPLMVSKALPARLPMADGLDPILQDTSEEDIAATRDGKVADCRNTGGVEGDRNVGGVIGAMAIEFDLDPEDDATPYTPYGIGC